MTTHVRVTRQARKQHYVPRFLLRSWTHDRKRSRLWAYDKKEREVRQQNVTDAATHASYYEVLVTEGVLEAQLARVENAVASAVASICEHNTLGGMDAVTTHNLGLFIALQFIRTPAFFRTTEHTLGADSPAILMPRRTTPLITSPSYVNRFASLIRHKLWTLRISPLNCTYLCSDHPVGLTQMEPGSLRGYAETLRRCTIHMPISPFHCLLLFPIPTLCLPGVTVVGDAQVLADAQESPVKELHQLNVHQVLMSQRYVYSLDCAFAIVDDCLQKNPLASQGPLTMDGRQIVW